MIQCEESAITIAAALGGRSALYTPTEGSQDLRAEAQRAHRSFLYGDLIESNGSTVPMDSLSDKANDASFNSIGSYSDQLAVLRAYNRWDSVLRSSGPEAAYQFCRRMFLSQTVLNDMKQLREHFRDYLSRTGFLSSGKGLENGNSMKDGGNRSKDELNDSLRDNNNDATLVLCAICAGTYDKTNYIDK